MKDKIIQLKNQGKTAVEIIKELGCSPGTVYWHMSEKTRKSILKNKSDRRLKLRKLIKGEIFGGSCCICGYNKSMNALDFHHLDRDEKEHLISKILNEGYVCRLEKELYKCIMVCRNCHCEIHEGSFKGALPSSPYKGQSLRSPRPKLVEAEGLEPPMDY